MTSFERVPRHIAVVMDGNGRWAKQRFLPRVAGHKQGVEAVRALIRACSEYQIQTLTVFAFSSENWQRPAEEVSFLMDLFFRALREEVQKLHANEIRFRAIGDTSLLHTETRQLIEEAERLTQANTRLNFNVAVNYGGRWDIEQAVRKANAAGHAEQFERYLTLAGLPDPDLFIRTGGEQRISNFLLWQLAYTELFFSEVLWPEFDRQAFDRALDWYASRERRFGKTSEQLPSAAAAAA